MGFLKHDRDKPPSRVQRAPTPVLLDFSSNSLNEIGRAVEAYRAGDRVGIDAACREAALLKDMLDEIRSRHD